MFVSRLKGPQFDHPKVDDFHCLVIAVGQRKQRADLEVKWENSYFGFSGILLVFTTYFSVFSSTVEPFFKGVSEKET